MISDDYFKYFLYQICHKYHNSFNIHHHQHNIFLVVRFLFNWIRLYQLVFIKSRFSPYQQKSENFVIRVIIHELCPQRVLKSTLSPFGEKWRYKSKIKSTPWNWNFTKTPKTNSLIYFFKQIRMSIPGRVPPRSSRLFQASICRQFLQMVFILVARLRLGDVLRSEPQTVRRSLNFSQCHFYIYQSTIEDKIDREKLVWLYTSYHVDIGVFSVSLTM